MVVSQEHASSETHSFFSKFVVVFSQEVILNVIATPVSLFSHEISPSVANDGEISINRVYSGYEQRLTSYYMQRYSV